MPEIPDPLPPQNPRAEFMIKHRLDLDLWSVIPFNLGVATAPLYDHLPTQQLTAIIIAILAVNWLLVRWSKPYIEGRIGVFRANACANRNFHKHAWSLTWRVWATFLAVGAIIVFLNRDRHSYRGNGWIESASGTWLCFSMVYCLYLALDRTNYRPRRLWYGIAALVLALGYYFFATSPGSFAVTLVLIGTTPIILGLLDLGLLFRFASTSVPAAQRLRVTLIIRKHIRKQMSDEKRGVPNLISQLVIPLALIVVIGIAQIAFAARALAEGSSTYSFWTIMAVGMFLNMGIIVYTVAGSIIRRARFLTAKERRW